MFELVHSDVDAGGEVNAGALGLSVDCVCVGALWLISVAGVCVPLSAASDVPVLGGTLAQCRRSLRPTQCGK